MPADAASPPAAAPLPRAIGKYRVLSRLGDGATSEVFLARDEFLGREVAVKRVHPAAALGPEASLPQLQARFFAAEAALVGKLHHPNVVQLLDAVPDPVAPYLVMEYVPGTTLRHFCRPDRLLPLEQIVEIGFKCAMALGYVYRQGLIHRDVKPANVLALLRHDEVVDVKISDFGSVLQLESDRTQVFRVGSLTYMSPEQLDGSALDARADMYSLGAVLYHLIAGRPPFEAPTQAALMAQIYTAAPPALAGLREGVPPALEALVHDALAKRAEARPATWDAFAQRLADLVAQRLIPLGRLQGPLDSERFSLLRTLEFFGEFDDVALWEVVHRARWQRFDSGHALYRKGEHGTSFHILAQGEVEVLRDGQLTARLGAGTSVGEMAYLAPSPELRTYSTDVVVAQPCVTVSFTPETLQQLSASTRQQFDTAFIRVLVRRLHAAHEALAHPRRIV
ncbi:serine/threonine-protein kinase [Azohydromonas caseinilytica]|uniref:Protein kinase n=1 Tax=Azohydromonas caseinilytica TaxID=2728836 RepID=A0A848FK69_9BURK|nr:serine/threonine-protein kinase [Azohydromonas caseinilytica]NML18633.1 protein kinase [Azohydromonas caseinilytica]